MGLTVDQKRALALAEAAARAEYESEYGAPPPGEIIHGEQESYISDEPEKRVLRDRQGYEGNVQLEALTRRKGRDLSRGLMPLGQGVGLTITDEAASAMAAAPYAIPGGRTFGDEYNINQEVQRQELGLEREEHPYRSAISEIAGGVGSGVGLLKSGLTATRFIPQGLSTAKNMGATMLAAMADAGALGGLTYGGSARPGERIKESGKGAVIGALMGAGAVPLVEGVKAAASPITNVIGAHLKPQKYANKWADAIMRRSGMSADDIADDVARARAAGTTEYTAADAMGRPAQRAVSTIARTPSEAQKPVVEALLNRQAGQSGRVAAALEDALQTPRTAEQQSARLTAARDTAADVAYGAARRQAGAVDISAAVNAADDVIAPGANKVLSIADDIADDSTEGAIKKYMRRLVDKNGSMTTDFNKVFRVKKDMDDEISALYRGGKKYQAGQLQAIRNQLDDSLANASQPYAQARDEYAQATRPIEAIQAGKESARPAARAADVTQRYGALTPDEQAGFRYGYSDPQMAKIERSGLGADTTRNFTTDKSQREMGAIAGMRQGTFQDQIARERSMYETYQQATQGSRTADNFADAADVATNFDPATMSQLITGDFSGTLRGTINRAMAEFAGQPVAVRNRMAGMILERNPDIIRNVFEAASAQGRQVNARELAFIRALSSAGAIGGTMVGSGGGGN